MPSLTSTPSQPIPSAPPHGGSLGRLRWRHEWVFCGKRLGRSRLNKLRQSVNPHRRISKDCFSSESLLYLAIIRLESGGNQQPPCWSHWLRQMTYAAILYVGAKPARPAMNRMNPHIQRIVRFKRQPHMAAKACPPISHAMQDVSEAGTPLMARFAFPR